RGASRGLSQRRLDQPGCGHRRCARRAGTRWRAALPLLRAWPGRRGAAAGADRNDGGERAERALTLAPQSLILMLRRGAPCVTPHPPWPDQIPPIFALRRAVRAA